ncbi:MAG TPA: DUF4258 domain-containing protein [Phycisphaerae bacterium]|nr:DUF4258 domain-containing protein [Phycisphaerae bacterium]
MDFQGAVITEHAAERMARRQVSEADVRRVPATPDVVASARPGRVVAHGMTGTYLLRVFVDADRVPAEVVTVYRTSKIDRYRS